MLLSSSLSVFFAYIRWLVPGVPYRYLYTRVDEETNQERGYYFQLLRLTLETRAAKESGADQEDTRVAPFVHDNL